MKNLISSFIEAIPDKSMRVLVACLVCGLFTLSTVVSVLYFKGTNKADKQAEYDYNIRVELRRDLKACETERLMDAKAALGIAVEGKRITDSILNEVKRIYK